MNAWPGNDLLSRISFYFVEGRIGKTPDFPFPLN
jgi:hypothetical protein